MSLDQDYPLSRVQVRVLVIGTVVLAVFFGALFGGLIPGLTPNYAAPSTVVVDGISYDYAKVNVNEPPILSNTTTPQTFLFHNASFTLWVTNWGSFTGGLVRGNGTEPNGSTFSFVLGHSESPPVNATLFVSPDRAVAVSWPGGPLAGTQVWLMVRA